MVSKERTLLNELFRVCQIIVNDKWDKSEEKSWLALLTKAVRRIECERSGRPDLLNLEKKGGGQKC